LAEPIKLLPLNCRPGIRRDGTPDESNYFNDGQWVRFQRGRPRKMGGYRQVANNLSAPVRANLVWSRQDLNAIYSFSTTQIEEILVDANGVGSSIINRTPVGFTPNDNYIWTVDTLYDDAAGSDKTLILAHASQSMTNIDDGVGTEVFYGGADDVTAFTAIPGLSISGGLFSTAPYMVYYGSDGNVTWTNANEPRNITTGDAGSDRVTGSKVVKGLSVPSGSGPGGLLWSLDSVVQMDYVGGSGIFRFTTLNRKSSLLAQNSIIEYDGGYYWIGIDRFMMFDGSVKELPNQMNVNWFFDNLNFAQRQKVWAMKVPRFGEIWWFFPYGTETECSRAVIYNVKEQTWYDATSPRSAGFYSQVFRFPVMTNSEVTACFQFDVTVSSGSFSIGNTITGAGSNTGVVRQTTGSSPVTLTVQPNGASVWVNTEAVTSSSGGIGVVASDPIDADIAATYVHETGTNAVVDDDELAIESYIETSDIGFTSGGPGADENAQGINSWTRLRRVEPDFVIDGDMTMTVYGQKFAMSPTVTGNTYTFPTSDGKIDTNDQFRQMRIRFTSNTLDGHYEMGRILINLELGDNRS
jgi:hypothetical protein